MCSCNVEIGALSQTLLGQPPPATRVSWITPNEKVIHAVDFLQSSLAGADKASVTKPRCVLPGITYLLTRRCSERRFFLLPEPAVTLIFEYLLGLLSTQYGIQIHAYVVMSNHYHLVVTDTEGRLPDFERDLNSLLARAVNRHWARWEAFWIASRTAGSSYSRTRT